MSHVFEEKQRCWGILTRRPRWGLSWRGWFITLLVGALTVRISLLHLYPFLALDDPVAGEGDILAVEGWIQPYAIQAAADEFNARRYSLIVSTGGPVEGLGKYLNDYSTSAAVAASRLKATGIPPERVVAASAKSMSRDRTYASALALASWLQMHAPRVHRINVLTAGAHARRTRLLYERALGDHFAVGVISIPSIDYNPQQWWRYSEGVREVIGETIAYIYAKFFFFPSASSVDEPVRPIAITN